MSRATSVKYTYQDYLRLPDETLLTPTFFGLEIPLAEVFSS